MKLALDPQLPQPDHPAGAAARPRTRLQRASACPAPLVSSVLGVSVPGMTRLGDAPTASKVGAVFGALVAALRARVLPLVGPSVSIPHKRMHMKYTLDFVIFLSGYLRSFPRLLEGVSFDVVARRNRTVSRSSLFF